MRVTAHGCRGSIPTASPDTMKYGGHTSCFELRFDGYQIVFDTGSGFQNLTLADSAVKKLILYSHFHHRGGYGDWDGMFTEHELADKTGWGHSSIEQGVAIFKKTDITAMIITHHAPSRSDARLDDLLSLLPEGVQFAKDQLSVWL